MIFFLSAKNVPCTPVFEDISIESPVIDRDAVIPINENFTLDSLISDHHEFLSVETKTDISNTSTQIASKLFSGINILEKSCSPQLIDNECFSISKKRKNSSEIIFKNKPKHPRESARAIILSDEDSDYVDSSEKSEQLRHQKRNLEQFPRIQRSTTRIIFSSSEASDSDDSFNETILIPNEESVNSENEITTSARRAEENPNSSNEIQNSISGNGISRKRKRVVLTALEKVQKKEEKIEKKRIKRINEHPVLPSCKIENCTRQCWTKFSKHQRESINLEYWDMEPQGRDMFILCYCQSSAKRQHTTQGLPSRRNYTTIFTMKTVEESVVQVCKTFFLRTLGFCEKNDSIIRRVLTQGPKPSNSQRGKHGKHKKNYNLEEVKQHVCHIILAYHTIEESMLQIDSIYHQSFQSLQCTRILK